MRSPVLPILDLQQAAALPPARAGFALKRGAYPGQPEVWELVPTHAARGLFDAGGDWLANELRSCPTPPRVVAVELRAGATDPGEMARVVRKLAARGITTWLRINGSIGPVLLEALQRHPDHVRVTVMIGTLNPEIQHALDPAGDAPSERIATITALHERGVRVDAAIEPLLPGCTDSPEQLRVLLDTLAAAGVRQVTAGYLALREEERPELEATLARLDVLDAVLNSYADGPLLRDGGSVARFLSKAQRQRGYAMLMALGAELGVAVRLSGRLNPDFRPPRAELPHHAGSLQQTFRQRVQPVRDADALGA